MPELYVRWMVPGDYPHVHRLEVLAYGHAEGDVDDLARTMAQRGKAGLVAQLGRERVGYLIYQVHLRRGLVALADLAVHPDHQRRGIARRLMTAALGHAARIPAVRVIAAVEESLLPAQLFLRALDFRCYDIVKEGLNGEDAYLFRHESP